MAPQGYADGLLKPANQVRAQKDLVKQVPGSNLPKQPIKQKRVKQSATQLLEAHLQKMKGLSGIKREVDFDKTFKTREQIGKMTSQANELRRGRTEAEIMKEA